VRNIKALAAVVGVAASVCVIEELADSVVHLRLAERAPEVGVLVVVINVVRCSSNRSL
jgi:hypothetical protein